MTHPAIDHLSPEAILAELRARELQGKQHGTPSELFKFDTTLTASVRTLLRAIGTDVLIDALLAKQKGIYGTDDRMDLYEPGVAANQQVMDDADSVVAVLFDYSIVEVDDDTSHVETDTFAKNHKLCRGERFAAQPAAAYGTGFLVARDMIATAAHVVTPDNFRRLRFVFGYRMGSETCAPAVLRNAEIYQATEIVGRELTSNATDWALVRLNRVVENHRVVRIRREGKIADGQAVHVIGHPSGLPTKYAPNAAVRSNDKDSHFVANLDTYGGNSGSPVFNSADHVVEGILVRGAADFVKRESGCYVSAVCATTGCSGEDCTRTTEFAHLVPA